MPSQVEASTVSAGSFFAANKFLVPPFQRHYSWLSEAQVADFWRDLSDALGSGDYFLGLIILTEGKNRQEIVDGQQRLVTITIFANVLRLAALDLNRMLVADALRKDFLMAVDYRTEEQQPRVELTDAQDSADLTQLLTAPTGSALAQTSDTNIMRAHRYLSAALAEDLATSDRPALRLGQWADFLTTQLNFAVFVHPDKAAAFRVYEVVNTRGRELTPSELIKSYLIGTSDDETKSETHERWLAIEGQFDEVSASSQLTTFVRHVVTLRRGFVIPRNLYSEVTRTYAGEEGVRALMGELERHLPTYLQMLDSGSDVETSDVRTRCFAILPSIGGARFRPIFLLAATLDDDDRTMARLIEILVPGIVAGGFVSGSIEAQFARATRRIAQSGEWENELRGLRSLMPDRDTFALRVRKGLNRPLAHVIRASTLQQSTLPDLSGHVHHVRPRNGEGWTSFDDDDFEEVGSMLGNWVIVISERRPPGARTPDGVEQRLLTGVVQYEDLGATTDLSLWSASRVRQETDRLATRSTGLWYGPE